MFVQVDAIMTLLRKIYALLAMLLFVVAVAGTAWMGIYVIDICGASVSESCLGLKATFGLFIVCLAGSCVYVSRIAWKIFRKESPLSQPPKYSTPLLSGYKENFYYEDEQIYSV